MDTTAAEWVRRASDPAQYDANNLSWHTEGAEDSPARKMHRYYLARHLGDLAGKRVLDVGAGTGHLVTLFPEAERFVALEPSSENVAFVRAHYPNLEIIHSSLQDASINEMFDVVLCVMVFEHIADIDDAFARLARLVKPGGRLVIVASDFRYWQTPRFGYRIASQVIREGEVVLRIGRAYGELYDITRTEECFTAAACAAGFAAPTVFPMPPTDDLIAASPRYEAFRDVPIMRLYVFGR